MGPMVSMRIAPKARMAPGHYGTYVSYTQLPPWPYHTYGTHGSYGHYGHNDPMPRPLACGRRSLYGPVSSFILHGTPKVP